MTSSMILGRYLQGDSIVHKLDPRLKLVLSLYLITLILFANNFLTYLVLFIFLIISISLTKIPLSFYIKGLKSIVYILIFTVLLQVFFSTGSHSYFKFGVINITKEGFTLALFTFFRFILIIFFSTILTLTTSPIELADALSSLLKPLKRLKIPVNEISLMLSIALRFIPTLMDEATTIMNAQKSRGMDFAKGNLIQRAKSILPIFIPLLVSSFNRADQLAEAMEARGYNDNNIRTNYRKLIWSTKDTIVVISTIIMTILFIVCR